MNKEQLTRKLAIKTQKKYSDMRPIVDAFCKTLEDALVAEEKVVLPGFGTFSITRARPFDVTTIQKKKIRVDSAVKINFRAGRNLKKAINRD